MKEEKTAEAECVASNDLLCVGDVLCIENFTGKRKYLITRVTKTMAMSKLKNGSELRWKRKISYNMSLPHYTWDTNKYTVIRKDT